jgi:hypothetical protein
MEIQTAPVGPVEQKPSTSWGKIILLVVVVAVLASAATFWVLNYYLFPKSFTPVTLSATEQQALNDKLGRIDPTAPRRLGCAATGGEGGTGKPLEPERYSEAGAKREVSFSERELNGLLAKNTDLADKLAIDLSENLASAKLLVPLDPEFPILGGKTLKVTAGLELRYANTKPVVTLTGVSLWGVPLPNAWLGGIKNVDLVGEFGGEPGFWQSLAAGIEHIQVTDGQVTVKLKE